MKRFTIIFITIFIIGCENQNNRTVSKESVEIIKDNLTDDSETKRYISNSEKHDCFVTFYSPVADIDYIPPSDLEENDSSIFTHEFWDKEEFKMFFNNLNDYCINDDINKISYFEIDSILFSGDGKISIEINETYRKDSLFEFFSVIYGHDGSAIISYKEILNKNEVQHKNKHH